MSKYVYGGYVRKGKRGVAVTAVQRRFKQLGYEIDVDGRAGNQTHSVIKAFQRDHKPLKVDGKCGINTQKAMKESRGMIYQEYKYDNQTTVIKILKTALTGQLIDVQADTVKGVWNKLKKRPQLLFNGGLFDTKTMKDLNVMYVDGVKTGVGYYSNIGLNFTDTGQLYFGVLNRNNCMGGSPMLLLEGKTTDHLYNHLDYSFIAYRHPRLGIGQDDKYFYVVVVNGRNKWRRWYGVSLKGLADIFIDLGCSEAMNLDGGGSISVINKLGIWLKYSSRRVANMIALYVRR